MYNYFVTPLYFEDPVFPFVDDCRLCSFISQKTSVKVARIHHYEQFALANGLHKAEICKQR